MGTPIECLLGPEDLALDSDKTRLLLIGGAADVRRQDKAIRDFATWFYQSSDAASYRERFSLSAVPTANPDGSGDGKSGSLQRGFPPPGSAYADEKTSESAYVWRWIGMHAPDLVLELRGGSPTRWEVVDGSGGKLAELSRRTKASHFDRDDSLIGQLPNEAACDVGAIPAMRWTGSKDQSRPALQTLLDAIDECGWGPSKARQELQRRLARIPQEISTELLQHYGKELEQIVYIPAVAVIGRMRHLQLYDSEPQGDPYAPAEEIAAAYFRGDRDSAPKNGSALSGHLVFAELARVTSGERRARYMAMARRAADLAFHGDGQIKEVMPFHSEMSDAVFMGGPILASVGRLTGNDRYFDACAKHLQFMRELDMRDDGLYRHSPLDESAWGRGNGFPAIGVAMCLHDLPQDHPARSEILASFKTHMEALAKYQDPTGAWHQVIDRPESYRELTSTCMITFAMSQGVRHGWLDQMHYDPVIDRAWSAIKTRIGREGKLVDVCTGTGKQKSLRAYYDRTAILGRDARGGAMALLVTNEIEALDRHRKAEK